MSLPATTSCRQRTAKLVLVLATLAMACTPPADEPDPDAADSGHASTGAVLEGLAPAASGGMPSVVYLEALDHPAPPPPVEATFVDQVGGQFFPQVQLAVVGQAVRFTNAESELHNVQAITISTGETEFNVTTPPFADPYEHLFSNPGVAQLTCGIHSGMLGYVIISPTPWAAIAANNGEVRIEAIPAGRYRVHVWSAGEDAGWKAEVDLAAGAVVALADLEVG